MNKEQNNVSHKINVVPIKKHKEWLCFVEPEKKTRCKNPSGYMVFNEDGEPYLSRLFACPCKNHLSKAIKKAWEQNNERT